MHPGLPGLAGLLESLAAVFLVARKWRLPLVKRPEDKIRSYPTHSPRRPDNPFGILVHFVPEERASVHAAWGHYVSAVEALHAKDWAGAVEAAKRCRVEFEGARSNSQNLGIVLKFLEADLLVRKGPSEQAPGA